MKKIEVDISIGTGFLTTFRNTPMEMYKVFREFIDNSLQSFLDHKEELSKIPNPVRKCVVKIQWHNDQISICDNAWGMDLEAFSRALKLNVKHPNAHKDQLSKFGVGLKTAACFASDDYIIDSKEYGSRIRYRTEMNLKHIEAENPNTNTVDLIDEVESAHYTRITLNDLNENCHYSKKAKEKVEDNLQKIYSEYLLNETLELSINNDKILYTEPVFYTASELGWNNTEVLASFENVEGFEFRGKRYRYNGYVGMLETGDASGKNTGFYIYQAGRAIMLDYHPAALFKGKNDYRYQRVFGVIRIEGDNWPITENKDAILWGDSGLEEAFIADLSNDPRFKLVFDTAHKVRKKNKPINTFNAVSSSGGTILPPQQTMKPETPNQASSTQPQSVGTVKPTIPDNQMYKVSFNYKGKDYIFCIDEYEGSEDDNCFSMIDEFGVEGYTLRLNTSSPIFKRYSGKESQNALLQLILLFEVSRMASQEKGLKINDSQCLETIMNDLLKRNG